MVHGLIDNVDTNMGISAISKYNSSQMFLKKAFEYNMPAVALTDHGNMYGAFLFWQAIDKQNKVVKANNELIDKGEKEITI